MDIGTQLEFKEFADLSPSELDATLRIYSNSFLPVETKRVETVLNMLKEDPNYELFAAKRSSGIVGFSLLYRFIDLGVGLLDYMAVVPSEQRRGIGRAIFNYTLSSFRKKMDHPIGLLLEVQKEEDAKDPRERVVRKDRITFYKNVGARLIFDKYLLPPQAGSEAEMTYLLIVPCIEVNTMSGDFLLEVIGNIHSKVYRYERNDLIERIAKSMPADVAIRNIQ